MSTESINDISLKHEILRRAIEVGCQAIQKLDSLQGRKEDNLTDALDKLVKRSVEKLDKEIEVL